ncbi:UNVERIFIED_CONTAM: hypothetical protein Sradi_5710300 [Sesamum radiatum]|uniref:Uncharacterized protein n=1 Tax=Sesamum radiatum TaxID=300843 RepID=A0AAW2L1G8_SESRA
MDPRGRAELLEENGINLYQNPRKTGLNSGGKTGLNSGKRGSSTAAELQQEPCLNSGSSRA